MAEQEYVKLSWTKTTVETFSEIEIDASTLRGIIAEHAPRVVGDPALPMLSERLDWLNTKETEAVLSAVVAHLADAGHAPEGELDREEFEDLEHDAEDLAEHFCSECEERSEDCTCCGDCGEAECVCEDDDDEDDDDDSEDDD